ncbi:hypothetical protein C1645_817052 [Glomus cerebriforme]|uniref:SAM domain-containing protein n=1 Tax=Glomus cerebriforme TaxID=658196 RepID=A0A397TE11_9GLOM|nr:hypothetical protein C1645_817052 [Glomus cerebriforme]
MVNNRVPIQVLNMADNINNIEGVGRISMDVFLYAGFNTIGDLMEEVGYVQRVQQAIEVLKEERIQYDDIYWGNLAHRTPSTSTTVAGNETVSLADEIKKYDTAKLIEYLHGEKDLGLDDDDLEIIRKEKVNGRDFLKLTEEKLRSYGMAGGPATRLADFAKEFKDKKLKAFSSYKTKKELSEVLRKYGIDTNDIRKIPPFVPEPMKIDDKDKELKQCITEIKRRMHLIGSTTSSNEAVRYPQLEVVGEEATGRVDYAIKKIIDVMNEELIAITEGKQKDLVAGFIQNVMQLKIFHHMNTRKRKASEAFDDDFDYLYGIITTATDWYFLMYTPERIYCLKADYHITLTEDVLEDNAKLRRGVKKVMEVIVSLLKDRVEVDDSPDSKRVRTKKFIKE